MAIQRLTAAYRSRSRPSSTLGAKASTVCPYHLDGDLLGYSSEELRPVIPVYIGYCAVFKVREEQAAPPTRRAQRGCSGEPAGAGLSKLNSMRPWSPRRSASPWPARSGRHARDRMRSERKAILDELLRARMAGSGIRRPR